MDMGLDGMAFSWYDMTMASITVCINVCKPFIENSAQSTSLHSHFSSQPWRKKQEARLTLGEEEEAQKVVERDCQREKEEGEQQ